MYLKSTQQMNWMEVGDSVKYNSFDCIGNIIEYKTVWLIVSFIRDTQMLENVGSTHGHNKYSIELLLRQHYKTLLI